MKSVKICSIFICSLFVSIINSCQKKDSDTKNPPQENTTNNPSFPNSLFSNCNTEFTENSASLDAQVKADCYEKLYAGVCPASTPLQQTTIAGGVSFLNSQQLTKQGTLQTDLQIQVENSTRYYDLYTPPNAKVVGTRPLVIVFHGGSLNKGSVFGNFTLDLVADAKGFLVIAPNGTNKQDGSTNNSTAAWNDCRRLQSSDAAESAKDVLLTKLLIEKSKRDYGVDAEKVFIVGFSNGGMMAQRVALELGNSFVKAAAASISLLPVREEDECDNRRFSPVPMLFLYGTADTFQPFQGGRIVANDTYNVLSAEKTIEQWRVYNGACEQTESKKFTDVNTSDFSTAEEFTFGSKLTSPANSELAKISFLKLTGSGHNNAAILRPLSEATMAVVGRQNRDIETAEKVWSFFESVME